MSSLRAAPTLSFHHGHSGAVPVVGFGTWRATGNDAYQAVRTALDVGYRHIDTAAYYHNHAEVGRAVADSGVARDEIFMTSKIYPSLSQQADATLKDTLEELGTDYLDLWLIHWPAGSAHVDLWETLLSARADGQARAVGVSNYSTDQVDEITRATDVAPALNQVRWAPSLYDRTFVADMADRRIVLEGYSGLKLTDLANSVLTRIARAHAVTTAQVVNRWHVDHDVVTIPKSVTPARISENFDIFGFALSADEISAIDDLAN